MRKTSAEPRKASGKTWSYKSDQLALWQLCLRCGIIPVMLKVLCWLQVLAVIGLILIAPCAHCPTMSSSGHADSYTQLSPEPCDEDEAHHCCHSINCSCGASVLLKIPNFGIGLVLSEAVFISEPPQLLQQFPAEIFQPPRTTIA